MLLAVGCSGEIDVSNAPLGPESPVEGESGTEPGGEPTEPDEEESDVVAVADPPEDPEPVGTPTDLDREPPADGVGAEETGPLDEADLELETEEGVVQIGEGDVPAAAASFPIPLDLDVQLASDAGADAGFSGTSALSIEELTDFYASSLPEAGYEILDQQGQAGVFSLFSFEGNGQVGQVAISQAPGAPGSSILVTVGDGEGLESEVPTG